MKNISSLVILFFFSVASFSQNTDSLWLINNYIKMERYIVMRDGVKLFTSIYIPRDSTQKHPLLVTRTPYSCAPYGESNWKDYWNRYEMAYFKEGYIMVTQDVRGRWMSEDEFVNVRPFNADKKTNKDIDEAS